MKSKHYKSLAITIGFILFVCTLFGFILSFVVGPFSDDDTVVSFNPQVQYQLRCARCHAGADGGSYGKKAAVMAHALLESPGPISKGDPDLIASIITNGLLPEMPAWKHKLSEVDIQALANYIAQEATQTTE